MNIDTAKHAVAVHVGEPAMNVARVLYPPGNWIGSFLLIRLLQLAILRDQVELLWPIGLRGPLNDCVVTVVARDREAAIKTIKAELDSAGLLAFCQVGISDGAGCRCIHPSADVKMEWLLDTERQELFSGQFEQAIAKLLGKPEEEAGDKE